MLAIKDLQGEVYLLTGASNIVRKRRVNGEKELSLKLDKTKQNKHFFDNIEKLWRVIDFSGEEYPILLYRDVAVGNGYTREISCLHSFYDAMRNHVIYETFTGSKTFLDMMNFIFTGSGYTFNIIDSFYAQDFENFGDDYGLELFKTALERYKAEFTVSGTVVTLRATIGNTTDFQYRHKFNLESIEREVDALDFSTYGEGYGKDGLKVTYTSPLADIYGIRPIKAIRDDRFTVAANLQTKVQEAVDSSLKIAITVKLSDLRKSGYNKNHPDEGDVIILVDDRLGLKVDTRIVEIVELFDKKGNVLDCDVTLSNFSNIFEQQRRIHNATKTMADAIEGKSPLPFEALAIAVQQATIDLQNAQTELQFPVSGGILAVSKTNPNNLVLYNSAGLGISTDAGQTFKTAMTATGIVADVITAGTFNAGLVRILTGLTNARIEMDGNGLRQYDVNGREVINFDPATEFPTFFGTLVKIIADNELDLNGMHVENSFVGVDSRFVTRNDEIVGAVTQIESFMNGDLTQPRPIQFRANYIDMFSKVLAEVNMRRLFIKGGSEALQILNSNGNGYMTFHNGVSRIGEFGNIDATSNDIRLSALGTGVKLILTSDGGIIAFTISGTNGQHINTVDSNAMWNQSTNNYIKQFTSGNVEIFKNGLMLFRFNSTTDDTDRRLVAGDSGFKFTKGKTPIEIHAINATDTGYVPIVASAFNTPSLRSLKKDIKEFDKSGTEIVKNTPVYDFLYKTEEDTDQKHIGFMYEESPDEIKGTDGINNSNVSGVQWKAIQEIIERVEKLEQENKQLKDQLKSS